MHEITGEPHISTKGRGSGTQARLYPQAQEISPDYRGSGKLDGKIALISGGENGISRAVAIHFAREGADIAVAARGGSFGVQGVRELVEAEGRRCLILNGDVSDRAFCERSVQVVAEELGGFDVLVNNGGIGPHAQLDIERITEAELDEALRAEFHSIIFMTQAALPRLDRDACIINTIFDGAFNGAKTGLTRAFAAGLADRGIRVNGVAPGAIWTPLAPPVISRDDLPRYGQDTLLGRPGHPSEVAPAYVFLASSDSSYITGQILHPNGGERGET